MFEPGEAGNSRKSQNTALKYRQVCYKNGIPISAKLQAERADTQISALHDELYRNHRNLLTSEGSN
jgi:hypothetical protein